jgi:hypothetical protein
MTAPTPPDYSAWKYRATIRITNPTTTAGYQHKLTLTWKPGMRSDFRDIRFAQQNGTNCPYWIESKTDRSTATVWIKVPSASQGLMFLYFGNGMAASASSGDTTFDFFDDFPGSSLDAAKWSIITGDVGVTGGTLVLTGTTGTRGLIEGKTAFGTGYVVRTRARQSTTAVTGNHHCGFRGAGAWTNYAEAYSNGTNQLNFRSGDGTDENTNVAVTGLTSYKIFEVQRTGSSNIFKIDDVGKDTDTTRVYTGDMVPVFYEGACSSTYTYIDYVLIRKYAATAPTLVAYFTGVSPSFVCRGLHGITLAVGTEYVFDPVNVDHGMVAGVGVQEVALTTNINHGMTPGAGAQDVECGAVNIYHPMYPAASIAQIIDPVVDSGYLIGVTVSQSMDDAMAEAVFEYDGNEIGGYFSGDYMTKIHVNIPDYLGTSNCVFVGVVPSSRAVYDVAKDKMTMRAVDYGLFLSKQTFDTKDLTLLPPDDQSSEGANVAKVLSYDGRVKAFQIGMYVVGQTSGAGGTIIEMSGTVTQRLTLYPASGIFQDDEALAVGGVVYAYADGRSVDTSYTPYYATTNPEDWVRSILRGTGIEPYSIESSAGYWNTPACPAIPFMFGSLEKKRDGLKRVADYMDYLWHSKPRSLGGGNYVQSGYFIRKTSIDTLLGLPGAATITGPDYFAGPITLDQDGELQVDVVRVRCQDVYGTWLPDEIRSNSYYDAGEGPYREFTDEPKDICTQADLAAYATDMYNLYSARTCSWTGTLLERSGLQLYQLLSISGMGTGVPDGSYRITRISHEYGCAKNLTHITFMLDTSFSILRKYGMTYKDSISKVQQITQGLENRKPQTELATVTATDGWSIVYKTEAGNTGKGRDSTSTPTTDGVIPVGAKIQVQTIRGGVVCIPIVAASSSSTDLLVVDVPTIVSAAVDPANSNYWYLQWAPGANNQNVSVNIQTGSYPTTHGSVSGSGSLTRLYPKTTMKLRVRFSGPSTTYYVKLWGERNGVYSSAAAQITITSGSDVRPGDDEEPEKIGVIDELLAVGYTADAADGSSIEIFNGALSFSYNGTDNIYIGGPVSDTSITDFSDANGGITYWIPQPSPRYMFLDNWLTITGSSGRSITVGDYLSVGWRAPVNIKSILDTGANSLVITLHNNTNPGLFNPLGITPLWIRTYYL